MTLHYYSKNFPLSYRNISQLSHPT